MTVVTFRPFRNDDNYATFKIFQQSVMDLGERLGMMTITGGHDPAVLEELWERRRPLVEHLTTTAEQCWLAEADERPVGYARSIHRDGVRQMTDFFVLPDQQSAGVGRELLWRAFPMNGAAHRVIIATIDARAQARYLKAGVYPRFPIYHFSRKAEVVNVETDLTIELITESPDHMAALSAMDQIVLGYRRDVDHIWLLEQRQQGFLYYRNGEPVGYGYIGYGDGPFALLDADDYPAVLAHAEREAAKHNRNFGIEVPLINRAAVDYLLKRGFQMDSFFVFFMSDESFGKYENYLFTSPTFFS